MKEIPEYEKDLASIRAIMERSVKFISLSGLSGVLSGVYALGGAILTYLVIYHPFSPFGFRLYMISEDVVIFKLLTIAAGVLVLSLGTGVLLSVRKASKLGVNFWNKTGQQLLIDLLIPLVTGGLFILILLSHGYFEMVASVCLIFYGLALINASRNTYPEVLYLGLTEILLGLFCAALPGYGLIFWSIGFGVMHIIYGAVAHYRYDR